MNADVEKKPKIDHDFFRDEFRRCKQLSLADIDVDNFNRKSLEKFQPKTLEISNGVCARHCASIGLRSAGMWKVTTLGGIAGFYFIQNSMHNLAKWYWVLRSLVDFTRFPIKSNLTAEAPLHTHRYPWESYDPNFNKTKGSNEKKQPIERLRWTTLGYQYNWETKKYYASHYVDFPQDLARLCQFYVETVGLGQDYNPETAIVNFYPEGSTLGVHCDNLEWDSTSPLVSISLAHSALFLLGEADRARQPISLLLRSGDVVIMTESCRERFHAVPKIFITDEMNKQDFMSSKDSFESEMENIHCSCGTENCASDEDEYFLTNQIEHFNENDIEKAVEYIRTRRINLNVRQLNKLGNPLPTDSTETDPRLLLADGQTLT